MKRSLSVFWLFLLSACAANPVPRAPHQSPYFETVSRELHLGGSVYAYADIDGDAQQAAEFLLTLLRDVRGPGWADGARGVNATTLTRVLGLDRVKAIGWSSYQDGELYRNRSFVHHVDARAGLLRSFGGDPQSFDAVDVAPRRTDLVWEQQLDFGALVDVLRGLADAGVGISSKKLERWLDQPALGLPSSMGSLLSELQARAGLVLAIDESRALRIPGEPFTFPYVDFLVQVDGVEKLGDEMLRRAESDPFLRIERSDRWVRVSPSIRLPPPWNAYEPALVKELASGRLYLVSSPAFLKECLGTVEGASSTSGYARAMEGLPESGNGMLFMSPRMTRHMHRALDQVVAAHGQSALALVSRFLLPDAGHPVGWVVQNKADGILFASNTPSSHKSTLLTLGFAAALPAAAVFGASLSEDELTPSK